MYRISSWLWGLVATCFALYDSLAVWVWRCGGEFGGRLLTCAVRMRCGAAKRSGLGGVGVGGLRNEVGLGAKILGSPTLRTGKLGADERGWTDCRYVFQSEEGEKDGTGVVFWILGVVGPGGVGFEAAHFPFAVRKQVIFCRLGFRRGWRNRIELLCGAYRPEVLPSPVRLWAGAPALLWLWLVCPAGCSGAGCGWIR